MTRIIGAFALVVALGAMIAAGTGAFFSDSETSSNNILTAGAIDLTVDHERQTYNGYDCETCSINIWSSTATQVISGTGAYDGEYPTNAVELTYIHPNWLEEIPGSDAEWIWVTDGVLPEDTTNGAEYTFEHTFYWNGSIENINLNLAFAADNGYKIVFNGETIADELGTEYNYGSEVDTSGYTSAMINEVQNGLNTIEFTIRNKPGSSDPEANPAGLLFDLLIERPDEECNDDTSFQNICRLWSAKDLEEGDTFYNFGDVKPGDWGTNLISLHVMSNDAHTCLITHNVESTDETCVDPEQAPDAENGACVDPDGEGELDDGLEAAAWIDTDMDGEYDGDEDIVWTGMLADLTADVDVLGNDTLYLGTVWCAGKLTITEDINGYSCDGTLFAPGNAAQTDRLEMDLTAWAEQERNNENFSCDEVRRMLEAEQDAS